MTRRLLRRSRRGLATVIILVLLAMTLGVAYTVLRSQSTNAQLQSNSNLDSLARQAAMTGCSIALRKMSESGWNINNTLSGSIGTSQTYAVKYTTGDPTLTTTGTAASDYPYRITITSLGQATDPSRPTIAATHTVQAVAKLLVRQTSTIPATLTSALNYTVYQYSNDDFNLQLPCSVTGPLWLQGNVTLANSYPPSSDGFSKFMNDLNTMRGAGYGDWRPLNGPVSVPSSKISGSTLGVLTGNLGVTCTYIGSTNAVGWNFPGAVQTYQLYPGGQAYTVPTVGGSVANTTLAADPKTNPLGLFYRSGSLTIGSNVTVSGTLLVGSTLTISGQNVSITAPSLPALFGSKQPVQLPAVVCSGSFRIASGASATVSGLVATWNTFDVLQGSSSTTLNLQGRVICNGFEIEERTDWNNISSFLWSIYWSLFNGQNSMPYYPVWIGYFGYSPTPTLTVSAEASPVTYQWKDATNTVYVVGSSDPGLTWTVLSWTETF
ncbi:MAG TPA: hypothetical protein VHV77_10695 [Pirellulales bacterium]|nr:hypothetical protein [Pirellulales bacterium]